MRIEASGRLVSLDIFRGLTIGAMIVVNNLRDWSDLPGFRQLAHTEWHGCTLADLIFPFFIFIVGVTAVFSLEKRQTAGESLPRLYRHIFIRSALLFFLGLLVCSYFIIGWLLQTICPPTATQESMWAILLSPPAPSKLWFFSLANLRIMGILQRIALVYLVVALLIIRTRWRLQAVTFAALLLLYWGLMSLPGFQLEPGKDLGAYLDRLILGEGHLWLTWDPESLLGTLPAIATGLAGALTGHWLLSSRSGSRKLLGMLLFGVLGISLGALWGQVFPLNKFLWTSSYVVYTAGFALVFLGSVYWLIDLRQVRGAWDQPCVWLGMNPLIAYCGSQVMFIALQILYIGTPPQHTHLISVISNALFGVNWDVSGVTGWRDPHWPALIWALICLSFWTMVTGLMYRRRLFLKI